MTTTSTNTHPSIRPWGRMLAYALLAMAVVTCDSPTAPGRPGVVAVAPRLAPVFSRLSFSGLVVDQVRITITRPPTEIVAQQTFAFAPESSQINAAMDVLVRGNGETFDALIELLAGGAVVFSGSDTVHVVPGPAQPGATPVSIAVTYTGPGTNIARLSVAPANATLLFGQTVPLTVTATDSQSNPVTAFYVGWRSTDAAHRVDALGRLTAGNQRGSFWVVAETPTGIRDSVPVMVSPTASAISAYAGNAQTGTISTALAQPLVAKVIAADGLPVGGVAVTFSVVTGGGSVQTANVTTDTLGLASTLVTLGATVGTQTFRAAAAGAGQADFTITANPGAGTPFILQKVAGDAQSAVQSTAVAIAPRVRVLDVTNAPVAGAQVQFAVTAGGGSVTGGTATTDAAGYAQVGSWTLGAALGANTLTATLPGYSFVTAATFTATATALLPAISLSVPGNLVSMQGPTVLTVTLAQAAPAGGAVVTVSSDSSQYVTVAAPGTVTIAQGATQGVIDLNGVAPGVSIIRATASGYAAAALTVGVTASVLTVTPATVTVGQSTTVTITANPAPAANLAVTVSSTDINIATVTTPNVQINAGQTTTTATVHGVAFGAAGILATAPGYLQGGNAVTVYGVPTTLLLLSGGNQTASPGTQLPQPIVALVTDALGNPVPGFTVSFAVTAGGGSVTPTSTTTNTSGQASTTWTLGPATGTQTISVTASGLTGSPLTVAANAPVIVSTVVSPHLDTITAINGTRTLVAQAKDATGGNLTGSFAWTSRTPAVAAVNAAGVVTGLTNGSTYVVATEAGGTKDSALIVVEQRIASINVAPATRSIYLTQNFQFTATAVDGLGTALPTQPTFTWTSMAPAVATVDATGKVTGIGLGAAQIRATSGAVIGVANVSIITPITRIAVVVDTVGAAVTDTFTMTSLGLTRRYRAVAHDTLDAVMTGISFAWASTNGSVAVMNTLTGDTASVTSAANGVTEIRATAQGFTSTPGASLTVQQVLASIELSPPASNPTATIGVGGLVTVVARGKDANSRYIPGGTFSYSSANTGVATVNASSGQVTGIAIGAADITATSGAITSNILTVTVGGTVPAAISFGRDTVSVGRGSTASIPILLSTPALSNLTVNLSATAFAHWQSPTVTITAGQTSVNATLVGDSAGTTTVTATDGSGLGYAGGSAVAKVTANMRLTSGSYGINATDIVTTQILLSDPSPAGGTYVTFSYGTPGIAAISPDPAFIPQGQLAADIQIRGLAAGTTTITPVAIGVNGQSSSFTAYAPVIQRSTSLIRIGQGQYEPNVYVYIPTSQNVPLVVSLTSSDTNIVTVTPTVTIPAGSNYAYFTTGAKAIGTATISMAATGWTAAGTITVQATTPYVGLSGGGSRFTTSPLENITVYAEDSLRNAHYRTNSLVVQLRSSDTTIMRVIDTLVTINPGQYYTSAARVVPGGMVGSAYIVVSASGHVGDSVLYTVQGPPLSLSWGSNRIGAGQEDNSLYVYTPNGVTAPLTVTLTSSDSSIAAAPPTVTIPVGYNYAYFTVRGKAPGTAQFTATAPGYNASSAATYLVTTPRVTACCNSNVYAFGPGGSVTVYSADSVGNGHYRTTPLTVTMTSLDPSIVTLDSTQVTIGAGIYYNNQARFLPVATGTARIVFGAAGHITTDTLVITVNTPKVQFNFGTALVGRRQSSGASYYVYTPDTRAVPVTVSVSQSAPSVDSLSANPLVIPAGTNYLYFGTAGLQAGTDTLIATAPGYLPDTAIVIVTTPRFTAGGLPGSLTTTNPPITLTVYATDSVGNAHYVLDTLVVAAASSDSNVLRPVQPFFRFTPGTYYTQSTATVTGPGTASITFSDSAATGYQPVTTNTATVTGPSLAMSNGAGMLGMRQRSGMNSYVYVPNSVATDLVVNLISTDPRVATAPATVTIPAGSNYVYFEVTAQDTIGTIQIQATATGYGGAAMNVQVTQPKFVISTSSSVYATAPRQTITVYATDANGNSHYTTEDVVVSLLSTAPSVAVVDSSTVTIVAGQYYTQAAGWTPGIIGTSQIQATDARAAYYRYNQGNFDVAVSTPPLNFSWGTRTLGLGQYDDNSYVYTQYNPVSPMSVAFTHSGTARAATYANGTTTPITGVTIPTTSNYEYFRIAGSVAGTDTLVASVTSPTHIPDTAYTVVGLGRVDPIGNWPTNLVAGDSALITLYARDVNQGTHYVLNNETFTLAPNANIEFRTGAVGAGPITQVTIPAGQYYVQFYVKGLSAGTGSVQITNANYTTYTPTVTVQ